MIGTRLLLSRRDAAFVVQRAWRRPPCVTWCSAPAQCTRRLHERGFFGRLQCAPSVHVLWPRRCVRAHVRLSNWACVERLSLREGQGEFGNGYMAIVAELGTAVAAPSARAASRSNKVTDTSYLRCLVVAKSASRRAMLAQAAEQVGWDSAACDSVESGWQACESQRYEMAIVDLDSLGQTATESMRDLAGQIATHPDLLLMICGNEGDALEEIWARQLGAWLYLPGVTDRCDVEALCRQALPVAERLAGARRPRKLVG